MTSKKTRRRTRPKPKARVRRRVRPDTSADQPSEDNPDSHVQQEVSDNQKVGYGKPPKKTQFKPGQSGNPKGRPKKPNDIKTNVNELLDTKIPVRGWDGEQRPDGRKAIAMALVSRALKGDLRAIEKVSALDRQLGDEFEQHAASKALAHVTDKRDLTLMAEYAEMVRSGSLDDLIDNTDRHDTDEEN